VKFVIYPKRKRTHSH